MLRETLVRRVHGEFVEMPSLRLTRGQVQRLFGLRPDVCERVLAALVREGTLFVGAAERYRLRENGSWQGRTMFVPSARVFAPKAS